MHPPAPLGEPTVADASLGPVVRHIRDLTARRADEGRTDGELLRAFLNEGDQPAFTALVRRHSPLVLNVCRRVVRQEQDAEDACQATFLLLARRAVSIRKQESLACWLHGVAYRMATEARRAAGRRRKHEGRARPAAVTDPAWSAAWQEVQTLLDEEVQRLPAIYREPFVLCCLENLSTEEAARRLGAKKGTVCSRLGRARQHLQRRLARRGIALTAVLAALALPGARSAAAPPPGWLAATVGAATALVSCRAPTTLPASARAVALYERVYKTMFVSKVQTVLAVVAAGLLLIGSGAALVAAMSPDPPAAPPPSPPAARPAPAVPKAARKTDAARLQGTWLFESASEMARRSRLSQVWTSQVTVSGDSFALSQLLELPRDLKGKFVLDPTASPKTVDLRLEEFDLADTGMPFKIPSCTLPGIYKLEGDRLTICMPMETGAKRPTAFSNKGYMLLMTLVRAAPGFKGLPKEVAVRVAAPNGQPAAGATVARSMNHNHDRKNKDVKPEWKYSDPVRTGADGVARLKFDDLRFGPVVVRDAQNKRMAVAPVTPASLQGGEVNLTLQPECRVSGTVVCPGLAKAGKPMGWINTQVFLDGRLVSMCDSFDGRFELLLPPGTYTVESYGLDVKGKVRTVTVPADREELALEPLALAAADLVLMQGRPAPELEGVVGWRGPKVSLRELKGKYVLLEFWGYWCGPCIRHMPDLIELHEKYADRGLEIVGIHLDESGEVDTAAKLDEKLAAFKQKYWKGKDLPFPVALICGKRVGEGDDKVLAGVVGRYGVARFPTTLLIDREGRVAGEFLARDLKSAMEQLEGLLRKK
jgi:RNA polymerase sigma factor (sigma-70 family)